MDSPINLSKRSQTEQAKAMQDFVAQWTGKGYEKGESQKFWLGLLRALGVENPTEVIEFEDQVHIDKSTGFIDGYIPETKVLIEQKSINKDLRQPIRQSDGSLLNPFQQAKKYIVELPVSRHPRWVVTCNFQSFLVYDMNNPNGEPEEIQLKDLPKEYSRLDFLIRTKSVHIKREEELSFKAGELVGELYDAFAKQYRDITAEQSQKDLNELCVRLVFCLYAEDAGLFGRKNVFHDYLAKYNDLTLMRENLIKLFRILDTPYDQRDPYLEDDLAQFPYVNGGLFSNERIEIPLFTEEIRSVLLARASDDFNWSEISPTIFGAVFESTLNPETRRAGGMHYTSVENIHKVIDPLFLDDLRERLDKALAYKNERNRTEKLREFQDYMAGLIFFDPACGSGNFLTETYLSLRRLENEALRSISSGKGIMMDFGDVIKVSIQQFYGIEINDFAVKVAKTALWIAEAQMWTETQSIVDSRQDITAFLPLESYDNIVEGNALRIDWNEVVPAEKCSYIMGNPPFVGGMMMNRGQKQDLAELFPDIKSGEFDYVTGWYKKACDYIKDRSTEVAFVSTNSICQGQHVITFWKYLYEKYNIKIHFAYQSFIWDSEASAKAHVHCVIVGIANANVSVTNKVIYQSEEKRLICKNISPYLIDSPDIFIESRSGPICKVPPMHFGSMPRDGGGFILSQEEKEIFEQNEPLSKKWIRPFVGAAEFINSKNRYCLWLVDASPNEISQCPHVKERISFVRNFRLASKAAATRKFASTPTLFCQVAQPDTDYILVPSVSSERRRYIPIGFLNKNTIASNATQIIPKANIYHFGILTSNVHMAWMRAVAGRLKSDYRYSKDIVYNNFPWPDPTPEQKAKIEATAQGILDARAKYPDSSLANLYDELTMPPDLRKAHQENDKAVMKAYGFNLKMSESECVAKLMELYQKIISKDSER